MINQSKTLFLTTLWLCIGISYADFRFDAEDMAALQTELSKAEQTDSDDHKALQIAIKKTLDKKYVAKIDRDMTTEVFGYRFGEIVTETIDTFYQTADVPKLKGPPLLQRYHIKRDADKRTISISASTNHDSGNACYRSLSTVKKNLLAQATKIQLLADSDWQSVWFTRNAMFSLKCFLDKYQLTVTAVDLAHSDYPENMESIFRQVLIHDVTNQLLGKPRQFYPYSIPVDNEYLFHQYQQLKHAENPSWVVRPWHRTVLVSSDGSNFVAKNKPPTSRDPKTVLFTVWQASGIHFKDKIAAVTLGDLYDKTELEKLPSYGDVIGWGEWKRMTETNNETKQTGEDKLVITTYDGREFHLNMMTGEFKPTNKP